MGYVPQSFALFPNKSVRENILYPMRLDKVGKVEMQETLDRVCELLAIEDLLDKRPDQLSGGQKQLLAIAGVLVMKPAYVVLDEPTTLLDLRNKLRVSQAIDGLDQTAIMVTHDLDLVENFDRVIVFDQGRIIADDVPNKALRRYVEAMLDA